MEKQISSQTVFEGKIITVYHDEVECQNGLMAKREIVRHHGGVGILAIIDDHIILVKQYRYAYGEETIEIPAGKLEANEASDLAGQRELEEETGYSCQRLIPVTNIYPTPGYCDEVIHLYQAEELYQKENPLSGDEDEFINVILIPIDEAYQMVMNQQIKDSKTVIAIMKAYIDKHIK